MKLQKSVSNYMITDLLSYFHTRVFCRPPVGGGEHNKLRLLRLSPPPNLANNKKDVQRVVNVLQAWFTEEWFQEYCGGCSEVQKLASERAMQWVLMLEERIKGSSKSGGKKTKGHCGCFGKKNCCTGKDFFLGASLRRL